MLETWNFDDSDCETRFTLKAKLSEDQKWTPSFTEMAIKEYRRFLVLAVDQCGVVPSKVIDEVWHQHLLNTENYADMCEQLKISFLHHRPTSSEKDLEECREQFKMTLQKYKETFDELPPAEIWEKMGNGYCSGSRCNARCKCCRGCQRTEKEKEK